MGLRWQATARWATHARHLFVLCPMARDEIANAARAAGRDRHPLPHAVPLQPAMKGRLACCRWADGDGELAAAYVAAALPRADGSSGRSRRVAVAESLERLTTCIEAGSTRAEDRPVELPVAAAVMKPAVVPEEREVAAEQLATSPQRENGVQRLARGQLLPVEERDLHRDERALADLSSRRVSTLKTGYS